MNFAVASLFTILSVASFVQTAASATETYCVATHSTLAEFDFTASARVKVTCADGFELQTRRSFCYSNLCAEQFLETEVQPKLAGMGIHLVNKISLPRTPATVWIFKKGSIATNESQRTGLMRLWPDQSLESYFDGYSSDISSNEPLKSRIQRLAAAHQYQHVANISKRGGSSNSAYYLIFKKK
jgi:hypothetical protein